MLKKFVNFWKNFFIMVWEVIKSMKTVRGLVSLFISYMIFHGWAVLFLVIGLISGNIWFTAVGTTVVLFWFGPGTPFFPLTLITALLIQRFILLDQTNKIEIKKKWKELNDKESLYKKE
jgi:hypothetical protein